MFSFLMTHTLGDLRSVFLGWTWSRLTLLRAFYSSPHETQPVLTLGPTAETSALDALEPPRSILSYATLRTPAPHQIYLTASYVWTSHPNKRRGPRSLLCHAKLWTLRTTKEVHTTFYSTLLPIIE
jgi:hypothetical protein